MPARTTRQEARARIQAAMIAELDRIIPPSEEVPLKADVSPVSFYAWRRKLRAEATFVEVKVTPADCSAPVSDGIELQLPGCRRIVVRRGFDRQALVDLLQVLEHRVRNASQEAIA